MNSRDSLIFRLAAALIAAFGWTVPASAQTFLPSPYTEWSARNPAQADKPIPVVAANVKACLAAYEVKKRLEYLDQELQERSAYSVASIMEDQARTDEEKALDAAAAKAVFVEDYARYRIESAEPLAVLPDCKGLYLRADIEAGCEIRSPPNRWSDLCATLDGKELPGIQITEDENFYRDALLHSYLHRLSQRDKRVATTQFAIEQNPRWFENPTCTPSIETFEYEGDAEAEPELVAYGKAHEQIAKQGWGIYASGRMGDAGECPRKLDIGDWRFAFMTEIAQADGVEPADIALDLDALAQAGLSPRVGPFWQSPRLELEVAIPPMLVLDEGAQILVENIDGSVAALSGPAAKFDPYDVLSYGDKSESLTWFALYPTGDDVQSMKDPAATFLVARFFVSGENGRPQAITVRVPLGDFQQALDTFAIRRAAIHRDYLVALEMADGVQ